MRNIGMGYYCATTWGAERDTQEWFPKIIYTPLWTFLRGG